MRRTHVLIPAVIAVAGVIAAGCAASPRSSVLTVDDYRFIAVDMAGKLRGACPRAGPTVAVETSVGSATFAVDDRLRADTVEVLSDGDVATAHVSVHTDGGFTSAEAVGRYYADRRIIVRTSEAV